MLVDGQVVHETHLTPFLLQESKKIISVRIAEDDYYEFHIHFREEARTPPKILYVKRKYANYLGLQNL